MKTKNTIKHSFTTLPLLSVLAIGIALAPSISFAGEGSRGHQKQKYSHDSGRSYGKASNNGAHRGNRNTYGSHGKSRQDNRIHRSEAPHGRVYGHNNGHRYGSHNGHRGHTHTAYVVNDYYHGDHYHALDPLRFMIGLHTNNFDITFSD